MLQNHRRRLCRGNRTKTPTDIAGIFHRLSERQIDLAVEQGSADFISARREGDGTAREDVIRSLGVEAQNGHPGRLIYRPLFDYLPSVQRRQPLRASDGEIQALQAARLLPGPPWRRLPSLRTVRILSGSWY
jgi:hypothetical protein